MGKFNTFDQFLDLFPAKPRQRIKNGFNVLCPAHNDKDPSLSVSLNGNKILLDCKAGCERHQILAKLNLSERDLFLLDSQTPTIEAVYQYHDRDGELLFEEVRYFPKAFRQRRPDGEGGYIWSLKGITPVIYRLPDIITALAHGDTIFIVEGEKDCDNLWALGYVATTPPMGAGKWRDTYSQSLKGAAKIVVIPDNDEPGVAHANTVAASLYSKVKSIKLLQPFEDAIDVSEWLHEGHSADELDSLLDKEVLSKSV